MAEVTRAVDPVADTAAEVLTVSVAEATSVLVSEANSLPDTHRAVHSPDTPAADIPAEVTHRVVNPVEGCTLVHSPVAAVATHRADMPLKLQ